MSDRSRGRVDPADAGAETGFDISCPEGRRYRRRHSGSVVVGVFAFTVLGAYLALSLMTEQYEVQTILLVMPRESRDAPPTARNTASTTDLRQDQLDSEVAILTSANLLGQVVDDLGLEAFRAERKLPPSLPRRIVYYGRAAVGAARADYRKALVELNLRKGLGEREQTIAMLLERLEIRVEKGSDLITLRLRMPDPELAVRVAKAVVRLYLGKRPNMRQAAGVQPFVDGGTGDARAVFAPPPSLRDESTRLEDSHARDEQKALLLQQVRHLSTERTSVSSDADALALHIDVTNRLLDDLSHPAQASQVEARRPLSQIVEERLTRLEADRANAAIDQPEVTRFDNLDAEIAGLKELAQDLATTARGTGSVDLDAVRQRLVEEVQTNRVRLAGLRATVVAKSVRIAQLEQELATIEAAEAHPPGSDRDRRISDAEYQETVERPSDADIDGRADLNRASDVSLVVPPTVSLEPVSPRKELVMTLAVVAGLALAVGVALLLAWMRDDVGEDGARLEAVTAIRFLGETDFGPLGHL